MKIVLDVYGGDNAPEEIVKGAVNALNNNVSQLKLGDVNLVGDLDMAVDVDLANETMDNVIGILNIKDLLVSHANKEAIQLKDILREPFYVSENDIIDDVFKYMQKEQQALLIVTDNHHKVVGLVTLEDIVEEIVGFAVNFTAVNEVL